MYCQIWMLEGNIDKTKAMIFHKRELEPKTPFKFNSKNFTFVDSFQYLKGNFKINGLLKQAAKLL